MRDYNNQEALAIACAERHKVQNKKVRRKVARVALIMALAKAA